jgi:tryptophanyl-tRNA synthetase
LKNRVAMQDSYDSFILIADMQGLTDNAETPEKISSNVLEVAMDYLAVGIDPAKSNIVLQSALPDIALLNMIFGNLVTVARVERNPTVKTEMKQKNMDRDVPFGFFAYPVSQVADIASFKADAVPVGEDQLPMIELTNEVVRRFNYVYHCDVLKECEAVVPKAGRLPGIDGKAKMSKSLGNAIYLKASPKEIDHAVKMMFTDPGHLRVEDPGKIEGNVVFAYLDVFDPDQAALAEMKAHYQKGGLGDGAVKKRLRELLQDFLSPIRARREALEKDKGEVVRTILSGTEAARGVVAQTLKEVKAAMGIDYQKNWEAFLQEK